MISLVPNNSNIYNLLLTDENWNNIIDYIYFLNSKESVIILSKDAFDDIGIYNGYSMSSSSIYEINLMIMDSFRNGLFEEYKQFNFLDDCIYDFIDFSNTSNGFQIFLS